MSACRDACDDVGSNAFPFSMVILTERSELEASTGKGSVSASTRLPYLGQIREKTQGRKERGMGRNTHTHIQLRDMLQVPGHRVLLSVREWEGILDREPPKPWSGVKSWAKEAEEDGLPRRAWIRKTGMARVAIKQEAISVVGFMG